MINIVNNISVLNEELNIAQNSGVKRCDGGHRNDTLVFQQGNELAYAVSETSIVSREVFVIDVDTIKMIFLS